MIKPSLSRSLIGSVVILFTWAGVSQTGIALATPPSQDLTPQPGSTPAAQETDLPDFSEVATFEELDYCPPLYEVPLAINPHDHFYFVRPIAVDTNNFPIQDFRYGYYYPDEDIAHTGIDIISPMYKPILASGSGEVAFAGYGLLYGPGAENDPYGLAVAIRHDFGYEDYTVYTVYAHMDEVLVKYGDEVATGDVLGYIGMTGKTSGPHVHFEVRLVGPHGDMVQNPELWIAPIVGRGVLAGRIRNDYANPITAQEVWLKSVDTGKSQLIMTYSPKTRQVDDYFKENFAVGDLVAGDYVISIFYKGKWYNQTITVSPGTVNFVFFNGKNGFVQRHPTPPDPEEFLQ